MRERLGDLVAKFQRWLHLPDVTPLLATLGAVIANRIPDGGPVWLLLIGPPSSGKTELIGALRGQPDVHAAATLTEAALLSGTPKKERAQDATGGLLRAIGERGILVCKDFGSVLSMHRDARAGVLAALREIYDGSWTRHVGTDGGRTLSWSGRVGFIGGCTPTIDRHHAVMASLGERFLLMRLAEVSGRDAASKALEHASREGAMRRELADAVTSFLGKVSPTDKPPVLDDRERDYLVQLAMLTSRCRSPVERDGYTHEIELVPGAESPARLTVTLKRLHDGLAAIGVTSQERWGVVRRVALDSMPAIRRKALVEIASQVEATTPAVAMALGYPTNTMRRTLEDLAAYGVLERISGGQGKADSWRVGVHASEATVPEKSGDMGREAVPEMSGRVGTGGGDAGEAPILLPVPVYDDNSGTASSPGGTTASEDGSGTPSISNLGDLFERHGWEGPVSDEELRRAGDPFSLPTSRCRLCRGTSWWRREGSDWLCARCHPAPSETVVAERVEIPADAEMHHTDQQGGHA